MSKPDDFSDSLLPLSALESAPGPLERVLALIRAWREGRRESTELAQLDERLLKDIGLTRQGRRIDWVV